MHKDRDYIKKSDPRVTLIGHPAPAWMVNYADLMTELVCFFVVLYALSAALSKGVQEAKKDVEEKMKEQKVETEVKVDKDGMKITIEEKGQNVFFESGSAEPTEKMDEILKALGPTLKKLADDEHEIIVEGHTDNIPIHNARFKSNWELSTARATAVVQHMIADEQMPAKRMGATGYGEYHPLVENDTDEHRATNRRVVFFVKNKPPKFDPATKGKDGKEGEKKPDVAAEIAPTDSPPAGSKAQAAEDTTAKEPTAESALPLPKEAPAAAPGEQ